MRPKDGSGGYSIRFLLWLAMGFLALFVVLMIYLRSGGAPAPATEEPKRAIKLLEPRGEVASALRAFTWAPEAGNPLYRVKISDDDAIWPILVRTTAATSLELTDKEAAALTPGRIHIWTVDALDEHGAVIATGSARFRVTPPGAEPREQGTGVRFRDRSVGGIGSSKRMDAIELGGTRWQIQ